MVLDALTTGISFPAGPIDPISTRQASLVTQCPTAFPGLQIRFPGSSLQVTAAMNKLQTGCDLIQDKLAPVMQAVMTAMKPIFDLIDLAQKILACITAIPDAIANANPDPVIQCIPALAEKLAEILAYLLPEISVPPMIADIICVIKTVIGCLLQQIETLLELETRITAVANLVLAGHAFLQDALSKAQVCRTSLVENLAGSTKPLAPLIALANSIQSLVPGSAAIPQLGSLEGSPLAAMRDTLTQFSEIMANFPDTCVIGATT